MTTTYILDTRLTISSSGIASKSPRNLPEPLLFRAFVRISGIVARGLRRTPAHGDEMMRRTLRLGTVAAALAAATIAAAPLRAAPRAPGSVEPLPLALPLGDAPRRASALSAEEILRSPAARAVAPTPGFFSAYLEPQLGRRIAGRASFVGTPAYESARARGTSAYGEIVDLVERDATRALRRATRRYLVDVTGLDDVALSLRPSRDPRELGADPGPSPTQLRLGFSRGLPRLVVDRDGETGSMRLSVGVDGRAAAEYRPRGGDARLSVSWDLPEGSAFVYFAAGF